MAKPFDITTKQIVDTDPVAWLRFLGLPGTTAVLVDTDLSTSVQPDRLILVDAPRYVLHLELQASYDADLDERVLHYHMMARRKFGAPVKSVVVLLRAEADGTAITGEVVDESFEFRYRLVRMWRILPEEILTGPLSLLPLAPVTDVRSEDLPALVQRMRQRVDKELPTGSTSAIWSASEVLLGLVQNADFARDLFKGVYNMQESSVYQSIRAEGKVEGKAEGKAEGEREMLLLFGRHKLGEPDAQTRAVIDSIDSVPRLQELADRLFEVTSWKDLLA